MVSLTLNNAHQLNDILCPPQLTVDLQGFGQYFSPHVSHGVPTDVQFGQRGVAAQSVEDDGNVGLQLRLGEGQGGQGLQGVEVLRTHKVEFRLLGSKGQKKAAGMQR